MLILAEASFYEYAAGGFELSTPVLLLIFAASTAVLLKGADLLVEGAASLAYRAGISHIIVGATVISLGTTTPEAAVSVMAATRGQGGLALGNALGSVICDTGLVFGLCALMTRIPADKYVLNRQGWVQLGSAVLLAMIVVYTYLAEGVSSIGRGAGILLLVLLVFYLLFSMRWAKKSPAIYEAERQVIPEISGIGRSVAAVAAGLVLVIVSAQFLIGSATDMSERFQVPQSVVSATIVALGTSLPELAVGISSVRKGYPEIMVGNIIGADILNIFFVIGASATATPLLVPWEVVWIHIPAMLLILVVFRVGIFTAKESFSRWLGVPLLGIYVMFNIVAYTWAGG